MSSRSADIGAHYLHPAAQLAGLPGSGFRTILILAIGDGQIGPGPGAAECDGAADSTGCSGYQDAFPVQHSRRLPSDSGRC